MNSMLSSSVDVAIMGAGVAGLACALGLAKQRPDKRVLVLGASSKADQILTLTPKSVDFLESIGLSIRSRAQAVHQMRVFSGSELQFNAADSGLTALSWVIPQQDLQQQLETLCSHRGIARIPREISHIELASSTGQRKVTLRGDGLEVQAHLAVGADGAQSLLREAAGIACEQYFYPQKAIVAQLTVPGAQADCAYQWFGSHGILALLPMKQGGHCMIWSVPVPAQAVLGQDPHLPAPDRHTQLLQASESVFLAEVSAIIGASMHETTHGTKGVKAGEQAGEAAGGLTLLSPRRGFPLRRFLPEKLIADRVALMGDAAHVVHPLAGQGLNLGLGDVEDFTLIMKALPPAMDLGDAIVLRRYDRARAEPIALMAALTHGLQKVFEGKSDPELGTRLLHFARDLGWRGVNQISPLKQAIVRHASI